MDPRRLLSAAALTLSVGGCALSGDAPIAPGQTAGVATPELSPSSTSVAPEVDVEVGSSGPASAPHLEQAAAASAEASPDPMIPSSNPRPYLAPTRTRSDAAPRSADPARGRSAIAAANREARAPSSADAFVGGVQVFAWDPGRVFEVWTAPLRVTSLTLAAGETVTAKAAGDTVRWQIGESTSGAGSAARTHVLIKPLQAGLETNLILTTSQRVYLLALRSGTAEAFNAAIAWDYGDAAGTSETAHPSSPPDIPPVDVGAVTPQGPLDARYRIEARGRSPRWAPTAVFNDGIRTFIALSPDVAVDETPALFVLAGGEAQLVNYRQADGLLIVDRVFDEAELRLGDRRPQIVRIRRQPRAVP